MLATRPTQRCDWGAGRCPCSQGKREFYVGFRCETAAGGANVVANVNLSYREAIGQRRCDGRVSKLASYRVTAYLGIFLAAGRQSMLAMINNKVMAYEAHSAFWSPFVIVGEGGVGR